MGSKDPLMRLHWSEQADTCFFYNHSFCSFTVCKKELIDVHELGNYVLAVRRVNVWNITAVIDLSQIYVDDHQFSVVFGTNWLM